MNKITKIISTALGAAMALTMLHGISAFDTDDISVELDGSAVTFDVSPQIVDGRTMVPLRKIFEEIGALVKWDSDTQTVLARKSSKTITLSIGSAELNIDKGDTDDEGNPILKTVTLDVPAQIVSGRTLVPVRAISESFGLNVDWDSDNQKVIITSDDDEDDSWKENTGTINLSDLTCDGEGVEITDNQIKITAGGDYTLTGTLADGNLTIQTTEKVKLRLSGANITSSSNPCIFVENADKVYITVTDGTENRLVAESSENGAIYSKDNLEIKGKGTLYIVSQKGHGIKASDNLNIENGIIDINAASDGIHVNDTFKMTGGTVNITAVNDGIDSESIVNISGGIINIETNGTPIETTQAADEAAQEPPRKGMWEAGKADVEFEKSTKGINSEWMMVISGGEININSASHAIHCQDELQIDGGKLVLSSEYDKGISAHGNLTINGSDTVIDVIKSTEGIESKKIATINDGTIKIVASDDGINATGGRSGEMPMGGGGMPMEANRRQNQAADGTTPVDPQNQNPQGNMGDRENRTNKQRYDMILPQMNEDGTMTLPEAAEGDEPIQRPDFADGAQPMQKSELADGDMMLPPENGQNANQGENRGGMGDGSSMSDCLVINGGDIEIFANDDCLDSNGNLVLNGGTIKAVKVNGSFTGPNSVLDPDGKISVSAGVTLIAAGSGGTQGSLDIPQNTITVYGEQSHAAGDSIILKDENGDIIAEYTPAGSYSAVLITSPQIETGKTYTVSLGTETLTADITSQSTTVGTQKTGNLGRTKMR